MTECGKHARSSTGFEEKDNFGQCLGGGNQDSGRRKRKNEAVNAGTVVHFF